MNDIDEIFRLYKIATDFQKTKFSVSWPEFERKLIETEINENRQWKIVANDKIICVWATTFNDPQIWEERIMIYLFTFTELLQILIFVDRIWLERS